MYKNVLSFYTKQYKEDHVLSGNLRISNAGMPVGTPSMICLKGVNELHKIQQMIKDGKLLTLMSFMEDCSQSIGELIIPFPLAGSMGSPLLIRGACKLGQFCVNNKKPIIFDTNRSMEVVNSMSDIKLFARDLRSWLSHTLYNLDSYRSINVTIKDISSQTNDVVSKDLKSIMSVLSKRYRHNVVVGCDGSADRTLVDVVSLSFYKISDVIPIFSRNSDGVVLEVLLTNSASNINDQLSNSRTYVILRVAFSDSAENLLEIDGEAVKWPNRLGLGDALSHLREVLSRNVPYKENRKAVGKN